MKEFLSINPAHNPPSEIWNGNKDPHAEIPDRMYAIRNALERDPDNEVITPPEFHQVPIELLKTVHDPDYIDYLISTQFSESPSDANGGYRYPSVMPARRSDRSTLQKNGQLGQYSMDLYTPIHKDLWDAALTGASGAYSAALAVLEGDRASYAIGRPPGHHAGRDYMAGYCYLNNSAVAARTLCQEGRVGILDVDFHHGNGTEDIFRVLQESEENPRVLHLSIHADPDRMFPYFSGQTTDGSVPLWKGINFALGAGIEDDQYQNVLGEASARLKDFRPHFLVVPVGFDTHESDPIADFKLTTKYYEKLARSIMGLGVRTVFVQEGGYNLDTIGANISSFIQGINQA